jgi:hypothetical protein
MLAGFLLNACAGKPLDLYTLDVPLPRDSVNATEIASTLVVARVELPLELDNDDMLLSDGAKFRRSATGRWASRLSALVTRRVLQALALTMPHVLVTDRTSGNLPDARLSVRISTLAVAVDGTGRIEADWLVVVRGAAGEAIPQRFAETIAPTASGDQGLHDTISRLLDDLAARIAVSLDGKLHA